MLNTGHRLKEEFPMSRTTIFYFLAGLTLLVSGCAANLTTPEIESGHPAHANAASTPLPSDALKPLGDNPFDARSTEKDKVSSGHQNHGGNE